MNLLLNPSGGIAGDMFAGALISAGADEKVMLDAMSLAASKIGEAKIWVEKTEDGACRLKMEMHHNHGHLAASKARVILSELLIELSIVDPYISFARDVLEILIAAEKQAHSENTFLTDHHHHHTHDHRHHHHHHENEEAWLHEAQDIIIDIIGATVGMQLLKAPTTAALIKPVSLGGGRIKFSHGEMSVPAPATKIITEKFGIITAMGPIDVELCTPTGSAILAALKADVLTAFDEDENNSVKGHSRGSKDLPIPPLTIYLK
ncbi:LarC family nickel insertion protein [Labilibacter sediminis]|nr:LarC family nickel insertion protein [Labilibacter sediminis]